MAGLAILGTPTAIMVDVYDGLGPLVVLPIRRLASDLVRQRREQ